MRIKKGDKVKVLTGKDKGKTGKVLQVFPAVNKISVEGINLLYKLMRPRKQGETGQRIQFPAPFFASNVNLVCPRCSRSVKIGYNKIKSGNKKSDTSDVSKTKSQKLRICKKCQEVI